MELSLDQKNDLRYTVPSWFLENITRTNAEADGDEPGIAVVDDPLGKGEGEKRSAIFEILRDDYDAIQLTAAAALIRDKTGSLPEKTPSILLDMREDDKSFPGSVGYLACIVRRLARDLGAGLISVSPDDLEELGQAFYLQDQKSQEDTKIQRVTKGDATGDSGIEATTDEQALPSEQPKWDSAYPLVQFYFGIYNGYRGTADAKKRSKAAINALLNSAQIKREKALEKELVDSGSLDSPLLLHLMDLQLLDESNARHHLLHQIASCIEERRTAAERGAQRILGIASDTSSLGLRGDCIDFLSDDHRTFQIPSPPNYPAQKAVYMKSEVYYIRMRNIRRFKKILQAKLPNAFEPGLLDLYESEHVRQRWLNEVFLGSRTCSAKDLDRAAIQVAGRQWSNPTLTLSDVTAVTMRMRRKGNWDYEEDEKKLETGEEKGSDKNNPWERLTLKQRQDMVSPRCDDYEKKLLNCIVNPEELSTTYDDAIVEDETKEHVKQLVSLSRIRLEAASKTLLQTLRVSGALFYGAPGTGKTLLCKAISNDSSSNMLALRPSDIHDKYVGETEKTISAAFSLAAKLSPCVLFIDEVDALFYRRGDGDRSWERSALNQFLQEMDGLASQKQGPGPFVVVGTNRPADLDDAFLRRLPHKVLFKLPTTSEREHILRVFLHDDDVDPQLYFNDLVNYLANRTKGLSGSDLRSLCGHAALAWAMEQTKEQPSRDIATIRVQLKQHHFEMALRKTKPTVSPKSTKILEEFARQFNPEDYNRSFAPMDKSNITSKTNSTPVPASFPSQYPPQSGGISHTRAHEISSIYSESVDAAVAAADELTNAGVLDIPVDSPPPIELMYSTMAEPETVPTEPIFSIPTEPAHRSLGRVTEDCLGIVRTEACRQESETTDIRSTAIIRGLTNWYRLQFLVSWGFADEVLSWEQRYSYQMLFDWWSASFQHPSTPLQCLISLTCVSNALVGDVKRHEFKDHAEIWVCIYRHLKKLSQAGGRNEDELDQSLYTRTMCRLFVFEFCRWDTYFVDGRLDTTALAHERGEAVRTAYCHLAAMKCSGCLLPGPPLHKMSDGLCWVLSVEASDPSYPRTICRGPLIRACPWLDQNLSTSVPYSQEMAGDELGGWPEYLWDILNRRIVHTRDLQDKNPPYVAISHTWGRWELKDQNVQMDGGLELPVPCNSVFDVNKLPEMLTKVKTSLKDKKKVDYVWIDLLCIPQVPLGGTADVYKPWIRVQMQEIARQGSIFRNAWAAIAWFHDIDSLSCLGALFELLSGPIPSLKPGSTDDVRRKAIEEAAYSRIRQGRTGLLRKEAKSKQMTTPNPSESTMREPSSWFTSLWTLQEVCLRPDMWLATSDWDILTIGQDEPVPLSGFLCVVTGSLWSPSWEAIQDGPVAAEIKEWMLATSLDDLLILSQVDILRLADRRHCSGKRAEAIMSAIGATKWFTRDGNHEEELMLNKYPYEFIQEIRESVSGAFFATFSKHPRADAHDGPKAMMIRHGGLNGRGIVWSYEVAGIRGSLLPFSEIGHVYFPEPYQIHLNTHDSVRSWEITASGTVKIESACILSSSTLTNIPKSPEQLSCWLKGFFFQRGSPQKG